jgi:8-oxo-dGTP pyrophosphatase MutT (NUDIX family)
MSAELANFLRRIPRSNQAPESLEQLASGLDPSTLQGYVEVLQTIGVVRTDEQNRLQASSQTAKYMLESLAEFVEAGLPLVADWQTRGVNRDDGNPLQNAATLLHILEERRITAQDNPRPSRQEEVAQVLIKRTHPDTNTAELLFQYDSNAGQYQLIGGRRKDHETIFETITREIEEELADSLVHKTDYQLNLIAERIQPPPVLSPTFGALTEYSFWVYHMTDIQPPLTLDENDLWVPVEHIRAGYVMNPLGEKIAFNVTDIYEAIDKSVDGGLENLPDSFRTQGAIKI